MGDNSKVVAKNTVYAFIIKGGALAITFFSTPFFIRYFNNNEVLGLWYTLLSVLSWFLAFDLGVGNGIRNHLVKALTQNDKVGAKYIISSGILSVGSISLLLAIIGVILIVNANLNEFFNVPADLIAPSTLRLSTLLVFASVILRFLLTTVSSIFYALQKAAVNNFLALCVSILQFLYILIFRFEDSETALLNISWAYLLICNIPIIFAGVLVFFKELKDCRPGISYINRISINKIMGIGILFFLGQVFYLLISSTNEFFISHFWNTNGTAEYGFYYRISMLPAMMVSLAMSPTWSMITKAYVEGNMAWLTKLYRLFKQVGVVIVLSQFLLIPFLQFIMNIWLGDGVVKVDYVTAVAFACFGAAFIYSSMLSTIVCGLAKIKLQLYCYGIGAVSKIIFIVLIANISSDWTWVVWSNVFIMAPYCLLQQLNLNKLLKLEAVSK